MAMSLIQCHSFRRTEFIWLIAFAFKAIDDINVVNASDVNDEELMTLRFLNGNNESS